MVRRALAYALLTPASGRNFLSLEGAIKKCKEIGAATRQGLGSARVPQSSEPANSLDL